MVVDENRFFREIAMKICGSLDLDKALVDSLRSLRKEMPVDMMFLQIFDHNMNAMRIVAIARPEEGATVDRLTPLSDAAIKEMWEFAEELKQSQPRHVWLFPDNPYDQLLTREIAEFNKFTVTSLMVMPLGLTEPQELVGRGSMILTTSGEKKFSQKHAELLSVLKEPFAIAMANALRHQEVKKLKDRFADDNRQLQKDLLRISGDEIIGADFGLREVMHQVQHVAPMDSPVLLFGETGVGKDVIANAIHMGSHRREGPFIPVNCGAIPETLIDSELFGHEKGAFTGAISRKRGRFERAHNGTIFLDEIGEMPLDAQVRLLRVIQNHEVERIGGTERIPVDIRIVAATNKDLQESIKSGRFREDLWFRLNVFPIIVPPLRERTGDIPALVKHFIERKTRELKLGFTPKLAHGAIDELLSYPWPGNVRELENVLERALIISHGEPMRFDLGVMTQLRTGKAAETDERGELLPLDMVVANHIRQALQRAGGKIHGAGGAGELLKVNPNTLRNKMRKLGIPFKGRS